MPEIHKKRARFIAFLACALIFIKYIPIPCIFYEITGWKCPGCGMTRAVFSILHFNFKEAFYYNPFCYLLIFFILQYFVTGRIQMKKWQSAILLGVVLLFGVMRNL